MPVGALVASQGSARQRVRAVLDPELPPTRVPSSITISPSPFSVTEAGTVQLTAEVRDQLGDVMVGEAVTWASSNAGVASVNSSTGLVTGVASGTCSITATATNGTNLSTGAACTVSPAAVGSVTVSPTSLSMTEGATAVLTATVWTGANGTGSVLTGRTVTWASSNSGLASVTSPGQTATVTAVAAGSPTITATCETVNATAVGVTVSAAGSTWANEPGGMSAISDVDAGVARPMTGWTIYQTSGNNAQVVTDFTEDTVSAPGGLQINIPVGYSGGGGPEHQEISVDSSNYSQLFIGFTFMLSSNFDATPQSGSSAGSGSQKLFHVWAYTNSGPSTMGVIAAFGTSTSFTLQFRNQNFHTSNPRGVSYNITGSGTGLTRGVCHKVEALLTINSGSNADGICRAWLNGVQRLNATNLVWNTTGSKKFNKVQYNPTVQSTGWKSNVSQWIKLGHVYMRGAA